MGTFSDFEPTLPKKLAVFVKNVSKAYGSNEAILRNMSMNVEEGIVYGLLGSSGCGKTTILSCIVGLKKWDSGNIVVMGNKVENQNSIMARDIGYMPQDVALYEELTVTEMMKYYAQLYNMSDEEFKGQMSLLEELLNLPGYGSRSITSLSGGQKRRVSLALTLLHDPKLLILDEPTVGLDPLLRENIWQYLYNLAYTKNTTIIITTHYIEEVKHSNKVGIMRKGTLLAEDDPEALLQTHQTQLLEEVVLEVCRKDKNTRRKSVEFTMKALSNTLMVSDSLESVKVPKVNLLYKCFYKDTPEVNPGRRNSITHFDNREKTFKKSLILSSKRTLAFSKVVWINFLRHPAFIFLLIFLPPFQLFSTGIVLGVEPKYTPVGIVNHEALNWKSTCSEKERAVLEQQSNGNGTCDLTNLSCDLIKHFSKGIYMDPVEFTSEEDARYEVTRGNVIGYIQIPENYTTDIIERAVTRLFSDIKTVNGTTATLHMDMSKFVTMFVLLTELFRSFGDFVRDLTTACNFDLRLIEIPFYYREPVYGHMNGTARDYALPALIAGIIFEVSFAVTPLIFINDAKVGTLERSRVAGLKFFELVVGLFLTMTSITIIQSAICYVSLQYGLGFDILGSVLAYLCVCLATAFCGGAFGLSIGVMYRDELMVVIAAIFIIPILMIYAGILRPIEIIPHPYRDIIFYFFPTAAIVPPFRFIMNRGVSLTHPMVWPGIFITVTWGVVFSSACLYFLRKNMKS